MSRLEVRSGDATLSVLVEGGADKPPLLVSNSLAASLEMWDDQVELFTRTHRLIRYDTRGHGKSSAPRGPYDLDRLVNDMVAILDHLRIERADVLGLSLGGMTALGLGLRHPERVSRLAVCDARADNPPAFVASWDDRIAAIDKGGMAALTAGTLARWFTEECDASVRERAERMILQTSPDGYIACARALQALDYLKELPDLGASVLYVVGSEDLAAPKDAMEAMVKATPRSRFVVLPGLAHVPNMQDPGAFAEALQPWLASGAGRHAA